MYRSNPKNPKERELILRQRLVKAYTDQARFFKSTGELGSLSAALGKLSSFTYSSLEDLLLQAEEQEQVVSNLITGSKLGPKATSAPSAPIARTVTSTPSTGSSQKETKIDWNEVGRKLTALAASQSYKAPTQSSNKINWDELETRLADLSCEQDEGERDAVKNQGYGR